MITEKYVSFETAKLLKKKGFNCDKQSISAMYDEDGDFCPLLTTSELGGYDYEDFDDKDFIAPTLQMAMDWLRDEHHYHIEIGILKHYKMNEKHDKLVPDEGVLYHANIYFMDKWDPYLEEFHKVEMGNKNTPEAQVEDAINYCLEKLIK